MKKVTSRKTLVFPKLGWGIKKGETKELPKDEKSQAEILKSNYIKLAEEKTAKTNKSKL